MGKARRRRMAIDAAVRARPDKPWSETKFDWRETRVTQSVCPFCDHRLLAASSPEGVIPKPGDMSVCISCASALVFREDLTVRAATSAEIAEVNLLNKVFADKLRAMQRAVRSIDRQALAGERNARDG